VSGISRTVGGIHAPIIRTMVGAFHLRATPSLRARSARGCIRVTGGRVERANMLESFSRWTSRSRALVVLPAIGMVCLLCGRWLLFAQSGDLPKLTSVDVGSPPARLAVGAGAVWVSTLVQFNPGAPVKGTVSRIDRQTERVVSTIPVGKMPDGIVVAFDSVWVANSADESVSRIDPITNRVIATIAVGGLPQFVATGEGAVWAAGTTLTRIDPLSNRVAARLDLGFADVSGIAVGENAVWVLVGHITSPGPAEVLRVDPNTTQVVAKVTVGEYATGLAISEGAVWVVNAQPQKETGTVSRIDPKTNQVVATITVGSYPWDVVVGKSAVWVSNLSDETITRIDPQTNAVITTIPTGRTARNLAFGTDTLWFTSDDYSVNEIDAADLMRLYPPRPTPSPPPIAPLITFKADALALSRPILYVGREIKEGKPSFVSMGVFADGRAAERVAEDIGATWSPDGRRFAFLQGSRRLSIKSLDGEATTIYESDNNESIWPQPIWSPTGRDIAVVVIREQKQGYSPGSLVVIDVTTRKLKRRISLSEETVHLPYFFTMPDKLSWSPDGRRILVSWENAVVVDVNSGQIETISSAPVIAEWTPDGDAVYYFEIENRGILGNFYVRRLNSKLPVLLMERARLANVGFKSGSIGGGRLALSPSGSKLAFAAGSTKGGVSSLTIFELKKGETIALDEPIHRFQTQEVLTALEWAPGENSVAVMAMAGGCCVIKTLDIDTGEWNLLANVAIDLREPEVLGLKTLSWTR
jgi:YVTN family beta-propeller protein